MSVSASFCYNSIIDRPNTTNRLLEEQKARYDGSAVVWTRWPCLARLYYRGLSCQYKTGARLGAHRSSRPSLLKLVGLRFTLLIGIQAWRIYAAQCRDITWKNLSPCRRGPRVRLPYCPHPRRKLRVFWEESQAHRYDYGRSLAHPEHSTRAQVQSHLHRSSEPDLRTNCVYGR